MKINKHQRRRLKRLAHSLKVSTNIGKSGLTEGVIYSLDEILDNKELIKIKFTQNKDIRKKLSSEIISKTKSNEICLIGNTLIIYRQSSNPLKRHIKI